MDPNRKNGVTSSEKTKVRRKALKSFSIPKKQRICKCPAIAPMILHNQSQERGTDETTMCPSTSADAVSCTNAEWEFDFSAEQMRSSDAVSCTNAEWGFDFSAEQMRSSVSYTNAESEFDVSTEQMRSSEFTTIDELVIPPLELFTDYILSKPLNNSDVSYIRGDDEQRNLSIGSIETVKIPVPIDSSTLISNISRPHGELLKIPDVSYIAENDEQSNSPIDLITVLDMGYSPYVKIPENLDEQTSNKDNDEYGGQNVFEDIDFNETINTTPQNRKHKDEIGNRFEVEDHYNNGDNFGEAQNIQLHTSKEKGKPYRDDASLRKKHTDERGSSFEDIETAKYQRKGNEKGEPDIIQRKLTNSNHRIRSDENEGGRSLEEKINSFEESQNIQTDISKRKETSDRSAVLKRSFNTSRKVVESLNISKNPTDHSRSTSIKHQRKLTAEVGNSFEDKYSYSSGDICEVSRTIQTETPKKKEKFYKGVGSLRTKHTDEKRSLFEENYYFEDGFENAQNIQDEELQNDDSEINPTKTATYQGKGNQVGHDIIQKKLTNSNHQIGNEVNKAGRSVEDAEENKSNNFQEAQNIQIDLSKRKKTRRRRSVVLKTKRRSTISKKVVKSQSITKNPSDHSRLTSIKHQRKLTAEVGNSFEDKDGYSSGDNCEVSQNIQTETPKKKGKFYRGVGHLRRTHTDEKSSFEGEFYTENRFEKDQNIQDEELQKNESENSPTETATYQREGNQVGHDIIQKKLTNSIHRIENEVSEGGRSFEDERNSFQESQNIEVDISKRKKTPHRSVALKTKRRSSTSMKVVKSRSISKNHADVRSNLNEKEKSNWPFCCLTTFNKRTFPILQPVIRDDIPIDSITLMILGEKDSKKCKH